ncbi:MAG: hypothetical protein CXZ00_13175 [Acidobacteria bacterium]|nr:MAG: hypothetical protein CXZ00_13175 [Acidobacteriota bacterium]
MFTDNGGASGSLKHRSGVLLPAYAVLGISVSVIAGWIVEPEIFKRIISAFGQTKPNTALGFLFLAVSLLLLDNSSVWLRAVSRGCALCAALIGALTAFERLTGIDIGIDQIFLPILSSSGTLHPAHMSPGTAFNLTLLGTAILLIDCRLGRFSPSGLLTSIVAGLSFITVTGGIYDLNALHQYWMFAGVSLPAPFCFLLVCGATMFVRPSVGAAEIVLRHDRGGAVARRFLPVVVLVPFCVSLLMFRLHQAGSDGPALMVFLLGIAPTAIFVPLVLYIASSLSRLEHERAQSENELRLSTQRLSSVVGSAMDAIITLDDNLKIVVFNEAAENVFGCPAWEALGTTINRFVPQQHFEKYAEHIRNFGEKGPSTRSRLIPCTATAVRSNGEQFPIEATTAQVQVSGQKLYTVILRDITERKRAEETQRESEARFQSIYEQVAVGIAQISLDGKILEVNPAMCRMLGRQERDLVGISVQELSPPDDYRREAELVQALQGGDLSHIELEKRCAIPGGSLIWVNVNSSLVHDSSGSPLYRISIVQDVTERKKAEEQLKEAQKLEAIGRLAGGVAHDFNTLLNVMLGYSDMLLAELPPESPLRDSVMHIKNSGMTGASLTKQLLAFSRKQSVAQEVMDLREVAFKLSPILGRLLRDDIELRVRCSDESCPVKVDPGQIQQLVLNLVANAGDAMPNGGRLNIEVKAVEADEAFVLQHPALKTGRYALLAISDTGSGMDTETVAHIFEPFFTTKEAGKGTGLGLATVYGIVKHTGGDIQVYSEVGVGTVFKIYLPLSAEPLKSAEPVAIGQPGSSGGETILLVEDSAALREMTKLILTRSGYRVLEAEDGIAALEQSSRYNGIINLLLTDVVMPRMRGPQLADEIRKQRPEIAVVFLSGYTEEAISHLDKVAAFTLVEKPYAADALLRSIRLTLDNKQSRAEFGAH